MGSETLGQSIDYRMYIVTIAGGLDTPQGPAPYAAGMQVVTSERGATNGRGDQQVPWGTHQRDQGLDTHQTMIGRQGTMGGQQKGADQQVTEINYGDKNWVSECGEGNK